MTEILLEVTTEEIRSAALEASQRAKGESETFLTQYFSLAVSLHIGFYQKSVGVCKLYT